MATPAPPNPPPPTPPPAPGTSLGCEDPGACVYFDVSDREILTSLGIFAFLATCLLLLFGVLRHRSPIFFGRRRLRNLVRIERTQTSNPTRRTPRRNLTGILSSPRCPEAPAPSSPPVSPSHPRPCSHPQTHRPPPIPRPDGTWTDAIFGWMTHVLRVPDKDLVATAGIDALAFIRVCQFGIQLFVPITLVVIVVLVPIHNAGGDLARQRNDYIARGGNAENLRSGLNSKLMRSTAANLNEGDPVMWIHVVLTWLITLYATWLLRRHTRTFALLRQLYLSTAGDTNLWRAVHMPETILQQMLVQGREMEAELDVHKMREQVAKSQINTEDTDHLALAGPSDREQQQHHGGGVGPDLLVGPDGKPVMLTSIDTVVAGGQSESGADSSAYKPKGGIPHLSTPTRADTGARMSLNFDAAVASRGGAPNTETADGDSVRGGNESLKVRRSSQLKPLKPLGDGGGDTTSPTVSAGGNPLLPGETDGNDTTQAAATRLDAMRANMRRSSVNADTFEALAVLATPVLAERVHAHGDKGHAGTKGSAEKVLRKVAGKFTRQLGRATTERSGLDVKQGTNAEGGDAKGAAPAGLGSTHLGPPPPLRRSDSDVRRSSTERGGLSLAPLRTNVAGLKRQQHAAVVAEEQQRRLEEERLAAEGGIAVDLSRAHGVPEIDQLPPRAGAANPAYSTPTSAAAAAAAAAMAGDGPIEAISPIEQSTRSGEKSKKSNIPVSLRKSIEEARLRASSSETGGNRGETIAEDVASEVESSRRHADTETPGPVTESFEGDGDKRGISDEDQPAPTDRPALRTYVDEDGRTVVYMGPPGSTPGGDRAGSQGGTQQGAGFLERMRQRTDLRDPAPSEQSTSTADALLSPQRIRHSRRTSGGGAGGVPLRPPVFEITGAAAEGLEGLMDAERDREKAKVDKGNKKKHSRNKSEIGAAFATLGLGGIGIDEATTLASTLRNNPANKPGGKNPSSGTGVATGTSGDAADQSGSGASGGNSVGNSRGGSVGSAAELNVLELSHLSSMRSFGSHGGDVNTGGGAGGGRGGGGGSGTHSVPLTPLRPMREALAKNPKTPGGKSHHEKLKSAQKARAMRRGASFSTTDELRRDNSSGSSSQTAAGAGHSVGGDLDRKQGQGGLSLGNIHFHESAAVNEKPRAQTSKIVARKGFLPADNIGLNPEAYTPHVKRVLEDIAEAHRARAHRRTASGGSSDDGELFNRANSLNFGTEGGGLSKHSSRNALYTSGTSGGDSVKDPGGPSGKTSQSDEYFDFLDEHTLGGPDVAIKHQWYGLRLFSLSHFPSLSLGYLPLAPSLFVCSPLDARTAALDTRTWFGFFSFLSNWNTHMRV